MWRWRSRPMSLCRAPEERRKDTQRELEAQRRLVGCGRDLWPPAAYQSPGCSLPGPAGPLASSWRAGGEPPFPGTRPQEAGPEARTPVLLCAHPHSLLRASSQRSPWRFLPVPLWGHSAGGPPSSLDPRGQAWPVGAWQSPRICQAVGIAALGPRGQGVGGRPEAWGAGAH